jgi:hypothetical protein
MTPRILAAALLFAGFAGEATANCTTDTIINGTNTLRDLINGSLICGRPGANYTGSTNDRWQEQHRADGSLWDHKLGVGNPVDPESQVGRWSATGGSTATYTASYGPPPSFNGGPSFTYQVRQIAGSSPTAYSFCIGASEQVRGTITAGAGTAGNGCATFPP